MALKLLEELDELPKIAPPPQKTETHADKDSSLPLDLLLMALSALSKRTIVALAACQTTLAIGSVLFLAYHVLLLPAPSAIQVTGTAIYAAFVIVALWLARK